MILKPIFHAVDVSKESGSCPKKERDKFTLTEINYQLETAVLQTC